VTCRLFAEFYPQYPQPDHDVIEAFRDPAEPPWAPVTLWLGAVLIAPVAEECFFRGILQTAVVTLARRRWVAIAVGGLLFGLAHGGQFQVIPALFLLGILLGYLYERTGSLMGPILLHVLFNLRTVTWEVYRLAGA
jgi:membrane protease YdiL (CAAX protease family)